MAPSRAQTSLPLPPVEIPRKPVYEVWPPRVESAESLDLLAAEIARVDALVAHIAALLKEAKSRLTTDAAASLIIEIEGVNEPLTLEDWRAKLEAAAEKYATKHREELLEPGRKSFDTNHARFGWKDAPPALEPLPDFDEDGNDKILKGLLKDLRQHLQKAADFADGGARFVEVKLEWRKKELLKAHADGELPLPILKKTGFTIREEMEEFYVKPQTAADLKSQSAEKPK
jgi:Bacteriophage Mu Gam like protein